MALSIFLSFSKIKTLLSAALATTLAGTGIHYGVIVPINSSRKSVWIEGSSPELKRSRGNPHDSSFINNYFTGNFGKNSFSPDTNKTLRLADLDYDINSGKTLNIERDKFSPEVAEAMTNTTIKALKEGDREEWLEKSYILSNSEGLVFYTTNFLTSYSFLSEIEFPYKSYFYMNLINGMTKYDFIHDLVWSLAEESNYKKMMIRRDSIRVSFDLEDMSNVPKKAVEAYPKDARKMNNFNLTFSIYNPNSKTETIFRKIPIDPKSYAEVNIKVQNSEIRPFAVPVRGIRYKAANWDLIPVRGSNFTITVNNSYPRRETKYMLEEKLNLIHGASKFFERLITTSKNKGELEAMRAINSPTLQDFKKIAAPMLAAITPEQIKKDVETWYGAMFSQWLRMFFYDIEKMIAMLMGKIFENEKGETVSFMNKFINDNTFRDNFYNLISFDKKLKNAVNGFFDEKDAGKYQLKFEEIHAFMTKTTEKVKNIKDKLKVTFEWLEEPKIEYSAEYGDNIYPSVSMKFKQKIELEEDFIICFKDSVEIDGKTINFDFSERLKALKGILSSLKGSIGVNGIIKRFGFTFYLFENIIPDVTEYTVWDKFVLKKDQSISITYSAYKSPLRPAVEANPDFQDPLNSSAVFGWKLLDLSISYDLSKFVDVLYQFYEKIDAEKKSLKDFMVVINFFTSAGNPKDFVQKTFFDESIQDPFTKIIKLVNTIFTRSDERASFWKIFLNSLLEREIKLESTQLFVGYSRAFFKIPDDYLNSLKTEEGKKMIFKKNEDKSVLKYDISNEKYRFPAEPKSRVLKGIIESFHTFYSIFYPNPPIVFKSPSEFKEYQDFLEKEGSTSIGFIKNTNKLKSILKNHYKVGYRDHTFNNGETKTIRSFDKESFPIDGSIDWNKVKISVAQLEISKAFNSVMSMHINGIITSLVNNVANWKYNIQYATILSEIIQRDLFLVSVNLMMEDGSLEIFDFPNPSSKRNSHSVHNFFVKPKTDLGKIKENISK